MRNSFLVLDGRILQNAIVKKLILCCLATTLPLCAENRFDNSTMDTTGSWKGSRKMMKEPADPNSEPNRVLVVNANKRGMESFSQEVDSKGVTSFTVRFRYRTKDYAGLGLEIRGTRPSGDFTYNQYALAADDKWHEVVWKFNRVFDSDEIKFVFSVLQGEGEVWFDDITVAADK